MVWFKNRARDYMEKWNLSHAGFYDSVDGWIGDRFAEDLDNMLFSDFYKDTYNQRPHLPRWFYVHALGLPMSEDLARTFCAYPVEEAIEEAKSYRENWKY